VGEFRGEAFLKGLVVLLGQRLILASVFKLMGSPTRERHEATVSTSKFKGSCEVKNLECSINYDARGFCSSWGKARGPLMC
jgi:hypothetical protein